MMLESKEATFDAKLIFMEKSLLNKYNNETEPRRTEVKQKLSIIKYQFKQRWLAAQKIKKRFEDNNRDWLDGIIWLPSIGKKIQQVNLFW